jgi:hypothetical protein
MGLLGGMEWLVGIQHKRLLAGLLRAAHVWVAIGIPYPGMVYLNLLGRAVVLVVCSQLTAAVALALLVYGLCVVLGELSGWIAVEVCGGLRPVVCACAPRV